MKSTEAYALLFEVWRDLHDVNVLWELAVIAASLALAWWLNRLLAPHFGRPEGKWAAGLGEFQKTPCCTSMTVPDMPEGTRSEVSFTSDAFSPKIASNYVVSLGDVITVDKYSGAPCANPPPTCSSASSRTAASKFPTHSAKCGGSARRRRLDFVFR